MRIVAGTLKGRRLDGPTWEGLRPTSDSLRETLFNVLGPTLAGARVMDAFAGTGAVGIEALSRGALCVTFVENDARAITLLKKNLTHVGVDDLATIIRDDFVKPRLRSRGEAERYDLIFMDPPYELPSIDSAIGIGASQLASGGRLVVEHSRRRSIPESVPGATRYRVLEAGDSALSFYTATEGD